MWPSTWRDPELPAAGGTSSSSGAPPRQRTPTGQVNGNTVLCETAHYCVQVRVEKWCSCDDNGKSGTRFNPMHKEV